MFYKYENVTCQTELFSLNKSLIFLNVFFKHNIALKNVNGCKEIVFMVFINK